MTPETYAHIIALARATLLRFDPPLNSPEYKASMAKLLGEPATPPRQDWPLDLTARIEMHRALRVLIGCERFGRVRDAFLARGHDAWSCDLAADITGSNRHIIGDVRDVMTWGWDLLAVMHPPCTRLCNSGVRWLDDPRCKCPDDATAGEKSAWPDMSMEDRRAVMQRLLRAGADLFSARINAPVERVACENPVMHRHAKALIRDYQPATQTIQPWWFGEPYFKATGLYLRGLPPLVASNILTPPRKAVEPARHAAWSMVHRASPGPDRAMLRSATFQGVADAMADQWGGWAEQARVA